MRAEHGGEHEPAAEGSARRESLAEYKPAAQYGKDPFQAQEDGGVGGLSFSLSNHLQGVCDTDGEEAAVENGKPRPGQGAPLKGFHTQGYEKAQHGADGVLKAGERDDVGAGLQLWKEMILKLFCKW